MSKRTIDSWCFTCETNIPLVAWPTLTRGLSVVDRLSSSCGHVADDIKRDEGHRWSITHDRSGLWITSADDPETAQFIAAQMGALGDWTRSGDEIRSDLGRHGEAVREAGIKVKHFARDLPYRREALAR